MSAEFLSIVVISYNTPRELPRTLLSLSPGYQRGIARDEYEVIVVDNGSANPPTAAQYEHLDMDLTVLTTETPVSSPVDAINRGLNASIGSAIGVFIDGARIASPGLLRSGVEALRTSPRAVVGTRGRYLGYKFQRDSMLEGYDQSAEDQLLGSVAWQTDGYELFDISVFDESAGASWLSPIAESNSLFMSRPLWAELNGYDPQFRLPGGGMVNLDTWTRAISLPGVRPIVLLGESTFHQFHGGVATNGPLTTIDTFYDDYRAIRGREYEVPQTPLHLWGSFSFPVSPIELGFSRSTVSEHAPSRVRQQLSARVGQRLPPSARRRGRRVLDVVWPALHGDLLGGWRQQKQNQADAHQIRTSALFDAEWYLQQYPDVVEFDPAEHYLRFGLLQDRQPGPQFDSVWYADNYTDVRSSGTNPLLHYLRFGKREGRRIRPLDLAQDPAELEKIRIQAQHVAKSGLFDADWYLARYPEARSAPWPPSTDYVRHGVALQRQPSPLFDAQWYLQRHDDVRDSGVNPLVHYLLFGQAENREIRAVADEP
jgi:hypothetical protein